MRVALYARYSSDNQRPTSIEDQLRSLKDYAKKQRWTVVKEYSDYEVSGDSTLTRPGFQALMRDAEQRKFDVVLGEGQDRFNRDLEDSAGLYKRLTFWDIKLWTIRDGEINRMHIAIGGLQAEQYLDTLRFQTRRGMRGKVEKDGTAAGGISYGYRMVTGILDADGEPVNGVQEINHAEAKIVIRIYKLYLDGMSPKNIAKLLNSEGIPGPRGSRRWSPSTIHGSAARGNGILHNELYIGVRVWGRQRFMKKPGTTQRIARMNPKSEWARKAVPHLRIIKDDQWEAVQARSAARTAQAKTKGPLTLRVERYLFSGLTKCGKCGAGYVLHSNGRLCCFGERQCGSCDNTMTIGRDEVEARIKTVLQGKLVSKERFAKFCVEYTEETNRLRMAAGANVNGAKKELERVQTEIKKWTKMLLNDIDCKDEFNAAKAKERALKQELEDAVEPPPLLHKTMAARFNEQVEELIEALTEAGTRARATEGLRALIGAIILTPNKKTGALDIQLQGSLAGILKLASGEKARDFTPEILKVAGGGFTQYFSFAA